MTDCKLPLEIIMSHDYCFGVLKEEVEKWKTENFYIETKLRKSKIMQCIRNRGTDRKFRSL